MIWIYKTNSERRKRNDFYFAIPKISKQKVPGNINGNPRWQ